MLFNSEMIQFLKEILRYALFKPNQRRTFFGMLNKGIYIPVLKFLIRTKRISIEYYHNRILSITLKYSFLSYSIQHEDVEEFELILRKIERNQEYLEFRQGKIEYFFQEKKLMKKYWNQKMIFEEYKNEESK